ncbi:MAG: InlB B-repeat-containing protein [Clostridia bacterium]|nr:InlB B-repeat-containing protein [Clostridia bacterium]
MKKILTLILSAALICGALSLTACADGKEYSVLCGNCENGCVIVADDSAKAGEKVILAARPNAGYKLVSYVLNGEVLNGCSFVMPAKDVTVSANFEALTYSITYVADGCTVSGDNPDSYTTASTAILNDPQKEGYETCGWYRYHNQSEFEQDMEDYRVTSLEGLYGDLTLYAKYYNPAHTITVVDGENGWCYVEDYYYEAFYGETYNVDVNPDNGYYLESLFVNGTAVEGTSFTVPMADVELTSSFKPIVIDINYELFGGENAEDNPASFTVEDGRITLSDATKEGFVFCGWYLDENFWYSAYGEIDAYDWLEKPLTLYAQFIAEDEFY